MVRITKNARKTIVITIILLVIIAVIVVKETVKKPVNGSFDLESIKKRGKILVAVESNSINYFIYKGQPLGFQYELLKNFADSFHLPLEIVLSRSIDEDFELLMNNDIDVIATDLTITKDRRKFVDFTEPIYQTRQVLVQRKPDNWILLSKAQIEDSLVRNQLDLAGKQVTVPKSSSFFRRLLHLSDEIGDTIVVVETSNSDVELIIQQVANGEIDFAISDEHLAMVNQMYFPNIDINTPISFPQNIAWAVRKNNDTLQSAIDNWLKNFKKTKTYHQLYVKYFKNPRAASLVKSDFHSLKGNKISPYDDLFRKYATSIGWDWRMLASLAYQESRFKSDLVSWAGASGLMQLMPVTAANFGIDNLFDPEQSIIAGVKYIKFLDKVFSDITDTTERVKFILAAYNAGHGHVIDARELAKKYGKNPNIWYKEVEFYLKKKSNPDFFKDEVVKSGYCRGEETVMFVKEVTERFEDYRKIIPH